MKPIIIDADTGEPLWTAAECAAHRGITTSTWHAYVTRGQAPAAAAHLNARTPLWLASEVQNN